MSEEALCKNTLILTPESFEREEWARLHVYDFVKESHYDFSFSFSDDELDRTLQTMIPSLLASFKPGAEPVVVLGGDSNPKSLVMSRLAEVGIVETVHESANHSYWRLSARGKDSIRTLSTVTNPINVLRVVDEEPDLKKLSTFQLFCVLINKGWTCRIKPTKTKLAPYDEFQDKCLYMKIDQEVFSLHYLLALLCQPVHKKQVEHFKTARYYRCLLEGTEYSCGKITLGKL